MKALFFPTYGNYEVLKVDSINMPQVDEGEYLVKVHSSSLTTAESMMRRANPFIVRMVLGLIRPKHNISGACFSGTVIQDGNKKLELEDHIQIFGEVGEHLGGNADYIKVKKSATIMQKPKEMSFESAACLCDGTITSYYFIQKLIQSKPGQTILINGATGSLGLAAIQIAKIKKLRVTAVCSEKNFQLVKDLGADQVLSYQDENYLKQLNHFDFIFDCVGKIPYQYLTTVMKKNGVYLTPVISTKVLLRQILNFRYSQKVKFAAVGMLSPNELKQHLKELIELIKQQRLQVPINQKFTFDNVLEAHRIIDSGHKTGNFVLNHD